jgi:hypothetical protein
MHIEAIEKEQIEAYAAIDILENNEQAAQKDKEAFERENIELQAKVDAFDDQFNEVDGKLREAIDDANKWQIDFETAERHAKVKIEVLEKDLKLSKASVVQLEKDMDKLKDSTNMGKLQRLIEMQQAEDKKSTDMIAELSKALQQADLDERALKERNAELENHMTQVRKGCIWSS